MRIDAAMARYLRHLASLGRSSYTIKGARYGLKSLSAFLEQAQVFDIEDLDRELLLEYQQELAFRITARGAPLGRAAREKLINVAQGFTRFLKQQQYLLSDPGETLTPPKRGRRDRLVLEILYDTGIRRGEAAAIRLPDLDLAIGYIHIQGKGGKDRVVPVSARVCELIKAYILFVRPAFVKGKDSGHLILNRSGHPMVANGIYVIVKTCARLAGIERKVTAHGLRHTCATHMLRNGAPVRHIQEMLGHASLETTQVYTHVTINDLKKVHARFHPSETLK